MLRNKKGELSTLAATLFWGSSFVAIKMGLNHIDPIPFVILRFLFASLFFTVIFFIYKRNFKFSLLRNKYIYYMAFFNVGGFLFQYIGMDLTSAIKASLLININVIFVMLISHFYLEELVTTRKLLSVIGGVLGIFLLITEGDLGFLRSGSVSGDLIVLLGGALWAGYIVMSRNVVKSGACIIELNYLIMLMTASCLLPLSLVSDFTVTVESLFYIVYVAFFCTTLTFLLWTYGLKTVSATSSSILLMNEVVFASILGFVLLGERLNSIGIIGAFIMILSIGNISLGDREKKDILKEKLNTLS